MRSIDTSPGFEVPSFPAVRTVLSSPLRDHCGQTDEGHALHIAQRWMRTDMKTWPSRLFHRKGLNYKVLHQFPR